MILIFSPLSLVLYRAQWLMVWREILLSMLKTTGCPLSPIWMARYYVGCLAACAEWQKQLSHLLHSIFICQPASGEARGDLDPPQRSIFVQQVKLCSKEAPKQTSFTPRRGQNPIHHWAEENIHARQQSGAFGELEEIIAVAFSFFFKMTISQCDLKCFLSWV